MHGVRDWHRGYICRASEHLSTNIVNLCGQRARCPHFWHKGGRHEVHDIKPDYVHGSIRRTRAAGSSGRAAYYIRHERTDRVHTQITTDIAGVFTAKPDGSDEQQVPLGGTDGVEIFSDVHWSPDGRAITWGTVPVHHRAGCALRGEHRRHRLRQLTPYGLAFPHEEATAHWSPDGTQIISELHDLRLFVVRIDGTGLTPIKLQTGTQQYSAFEPNWSPDGTRIIFCMFLNGQEEIYTANPDGSDVVQVTNTPTPPGSFIDENGPDWGTYPVTP